MTDEKLVCDRTSLLMLSKGELLVRNETSYRVCNEAEAIRAIDALEAGEMVLLTEGGRVVSKCSLIDGAYVEEEL